MYMNEYIEYKLKTKPYIIGITKEEYIKLIYKNNETIEDHFKRISEIEEICNNCDWD